MGLRHMLRSAVLLLALLGLSAAIPRATTISLAQPAQAPARITLLHAVPLAGESVVTLAADFGGGDTRLGALRFAEWLAYRDAPPGARVFKLFAGNLAQEQLADATPLLTATIDLEAGKDYTLAAVGGANGFSLEFLAIPDDPAPPAGAHAKVRLAHLAPIATPVDLVTESGQAVPPILNLAFKAVSAYQALDSDVTFDLKLVPAGEPGAPAVLDLPPMRFARGEVLSLFVVGGANGRALELVRIPQSARRPARLTVVHAAPGEGAHPLNLLINGSRRLEQLTFTATSSTLSLDEGPYTLAVEQPGTPPGLLASVDAVFRRDTDYIALIRPGDDGQGVRITVEPELPEGPLPPGFGWLVIYHVAPFDTGDRGRLDLRDERGQLVSAMSGSLIFGERRVVVAPAREYDLRFTSVGGGRLLARVPAFTLDDGGVATIYAVGNLDGAPSAGLVLADPVSVEVYLPFVVD